MFYQLTILTRNSGEPGETWFVLEHPAPTIADFFEAIVRDGFVMGMRHDSGRDADGARRVRRSFSIIISRDIVLQVCHLKEALYSRDDVLMCEAGVPWR